MILLLSAVIAYGLSAVGQVQKDSKGGARRPFGEAVSAGAVWFMGPIRERGWHPGNRARAAAFGLFTAATQLAVLTAFVWVCIRVPMHFFESAWVRWLLPPVLFLLAAPLVLPLFALLMVPLTLLAALPLNLLFPGDSRKKS